MDFRKRVFKHPPLERWSQASEENAEADQYTESLWFCAKNIAPSKIRTILVVLLEQGGTN